MARFHRSFSRRGSRAPEKGFSYFLLVAITGATACLKALGPWEELSWFWVLWPLWLALAWALLFFGLLALLRALPHHGPSWLSTYQFYPLGAASAPRGEGSLEAEGEEAGQAPGRRPPGGRGSLPLQALARAKAAKHGASPLPPGRLLDRAPSSGPGATSLASTVRAGRVAYCPRGEKLSSASPGEEEWLASLLGEEA